MAHELLIQNGKAAMMYVGAPPWHGLGRKLDHPPASAEEAITAAGLDWDVRLVPLYAAEGRHRLAVPDRFAIVPSDRWGQRHCPVFGEVNGTYTPIQNIEAFRFFDPFISSKTATYETAGALYSGEKVWVLAKIKENIRITVDDEVERYLLLVNGHDGNTPVSVLFTPVRVVCQNTLNQALVRAGGNNVTRLQHRAGVHD